MLRLAIDGFLPRIVDRELAVRFLHAEAKSADRSRFEIESRVMERLLVPRLRVRDRVAYRLGYRYWNMWARRALWHLRKAFGRAQRA
jgi:hypothetical protein